MALGCIVHELIFVVATVPPGSKHEIGMVVVDVKGEVLAHGREELDGVSRFLEPWLTRPCARIKFVCALLSARNACVLSRYLHALGYYEVSYNGIAYTCLTPDVLDESTKGDIFNVARCFASHIIETTDGLPYLPRRTNVYLVCAHAEGCGLSIAAGTLHDGVQLAINAHYLSDICEALLPWFSKQTHYRIVFVRNYVTNYAWNSVNKALQRHTYSLRGLPVEKLVDPDKRLGRFFLKDIDEPGFVFARCVLETFIVHRRCCSSI